MSRKLVPAMKYRLLEKGELIQKGDERDMCNDGWRDPEDWQPVKDCEIGKPAPDPVYVSHRQYRRKGHAHE